MFLKLYCRAALWTFLGVILYQNQSAYAGADDRNSINQLSNDDGTTPCNPQRFKIALDVGHTVEAPGAMSARGVPEYMFNLSLAKRIENTLINAGFGNTLLIGMRGSGKLQLEQRSALANTMGADLFISIHHDDVQRTYYSLWTYKGRAYHFSDRFGGFSIFVSYNNQYPRQSLEFAKLVGKELIARGMRFTNHHSENIAGERRQFLDPALGVYRYDQLIVLKSTKAPSVLLEAGIILNRDEETVLNSSERQELFATAVLGAIRQFCGKQQSQR
jgi:N-acetylmuramoyl-L-alanine amidase